MVPLNDLQPLAGGAATLGGGSFGEVTRERWASKNVVVAVKRLKEQSVEKLKKEAALMYRCREHKNIVRLLALAVGPGDVGAALVMEVMEGGSLADALYKTNTPLDEACIAMHVATGLHYLHLLEPPVLHRDVRAANVAGREHAACEAW